MNSDIFNNAKPVDSVLLQDIEKSELQKIKMRAYFSATIFNCRTEMNKSQKEFAKFMGVSQGMVSKWESGMYNFTMDSMIEIMEKLGKDVSLVIRQSFEADPETQTNVIYVSFDKGYMQQGSYSTEQDSDEYICFMEG